MKGKQKELHFPSTETVDETVELLEHARLGKQARVVFHDLSNHLTALGLSVRHLEESMTFVAGLLRSHLENEDKTYFEPYAETRRVLESFSDQIRHRNIRLRTQINENRTEIFGNRKAFIHIVTNLISNAIESFDGVGNSPHQHRREIFVSLKQTSRGLLLTVSDTGSGIKKSIIGKIFKPNFSTKPHGHGVGLAATKDFIQNDFGGKIAVQSCGKGTTFFVTIHANQIEYKEPSEAMQQKRKRPAFPFLPKP